MSHKYTPRTFAVIVSKPVARQCQVTCALSGAKWESQLSPAFPAYTLLMMCAVLCMQVMDPEPCLERRGPVGSEWVDVGR